MKLRIASLILLAFVCVATFAVACNRQPKSGFTSSQFQQADFQLRRAVEAAERGDMNQAENEFLTAHFLLHQIDLPVRNRGQEELANTMFEMKNQAEVEFAGERRPQVLLPLLRDIRTRLPEAAKTLGASYRQQ